MRGLHDLQDCWITRDDCSHIDLEYELRAPRDNEEWRAFHDVRRKVLFENRGKLESYIENHPDDSKPGNHPLILLFKGVIVGVIRIDISETVALFRRVAIREDLQQLGHGRVLLELAEAFAKAEGCSEARCNAAVEAVGFYERCGYAPDVSAPAPRWLVQQIIIFKGFVRVPPASCSLRAASGAPMIRIYQLGRYVLHESTSFDRTRSHFSDDK